VTIATHSHADDDVAGRDIFFGASTLVVQIVLTFVIAIFVKKLEPSLSIVAILFFRYLFCLPLLFAYGFYERGLDILKVDNKRILVFRTVSGFLGLSMWFLAVSLIDLSLATALSQVMPFFITILAVFMIGEKVGVRRVLAVLIGFGGVMVLLEPTQITDPGWGIVAGLASPFFAALMFIFLRMLGKEEAPVSTALWYNMIGVGLSLGISLYVGWDFSVLNTGVFVWVMLISLGVLSSLQQFFMALSHTFAPASVLAPVHYSNIPIGVFCGVFFFGEQITISLIFGTAIILAANYYILVRERQKAGLS
jgi:drug/metabolite transporter (DMT)-like permease